jgi:hypothetical protein
MAMSVTVSVFPVICAGPLKGPQPVLTLSNSCPSTEASAALRPLVVTQGRSCRWSSRKCWCTWCTGPTAGTPHTFPEGESCWANQRRSWQALGNWQRRRSWWSSVWVPEFPVGPSCLGRMMSAAWREPARELCIATTTCASSCSPRWTLIGAYRPATPFHRRDSH